MISPRRAITISVIVAAVGGVSYMQWKRRKPHLVAEPESLVSFEHPLLIINPGSGSGKAAKIGLAATSKGLGIETIVRQKGEKIADIANSAVDNGCDHLIIAGGDGSLARVAKVAIKRDVAFSCVPSGTRNHFAMDLGLDRSDPAKALDAAFGGVEFKIDVGRIGKRVFLNNVSFGIYADAIADPDYRSHKGKSIADAAAEAVDDSDSNFSVQGPNGETHDDIGVLLASNNPYWSIGPPDHAGRPSLDTGTLGVILSNRESIESSVLSHTEVKRWTAPTLTVTSGRKKVAAGVDGSLHKFKPPVDIHIDHAALRVVLAAELVKEEIGDSSEWTTDALAHLSGSPE